MTQLLPPKKEVALALLERSNVDIYLDPRSEGVVVPPQFRKEPRLILKIGLNMPVPIPDLRLDDESMSCTLSFNRQKFFCVVPWLSVFAMVGDDGRGMVWPDDVPQELAARAEERPPQRGGLAEAPSPPPSSRSGKGKQLRLQTDVGDGAPASERGAGKGKRAGSTAGAGKKKKDERPMLHAVPSPPPSSPKLEKVDKASEKTLVTAEKADKLEKVVDKLEEKASAGAIPAAPPQPRPSPTARGPKRELPPYLRVVK